MSQCVNSSRWGINTVHLFEPEVNRFRLVFVNQKEWLSPSAKQFRMLDPHYPYLLGRNRFLNFPWLRVYRQQISTIIWFYPHIYNCITNFNMYSVIQSNLTLYQTCLHAIRCTLMSRQRKCYRLLKFRHASLKLDLSQSLLRPVEKYFPSNKTSIVRSHAFLGCIYTAWCQINRKGTHASLFTNGVFLFLRKHFCRIILLPTRSNGYRVGKSGCLCHSGALI